MAPRILRAFCYHLTTFVSSCCRTANLAVLFVTFAHFGTKTEDHEMSFHDRAIDLFWCCFRPRINGFQDLQLAGAAQPLRSSSTKVLFQHVRP